MDNRLALLSFALVLFVGCASSKGVNSTSTTSVVTDARSYIGTPYKYAGQTSRGMDCSGLTSVVFDQSNISLARSAADQSRQGRLIKMSDARSGDLVFFKRKGKVFHVGIVSKTTQDQLWMIHSSSSKGVVEQEVLSNSYWRPKLHIIRRVF